MKAPIRAFLLASVLALTVAVPVFAGAATKTHESTSTCRTDTATGLIYCFVSEVDIRTTSPNSGVSSVKIVGTIHATTVDAAGNVVFGYDSSIREHAVVQQTDAGPAYKLINMRRAEEITEDAATECIRSRVVLTGDTYRINEVTTTAGAC
jgi:hypothetical protein